MTQWTLANPAWLLALGALPVIFWLRERRAVQAALVPFASAWSSRAPLRRSRWPMRCAVLGITLLAVALARPQLLQARPEVHQQGYDIVLAIDLSGSMLAEDGSRDGVRINRLQAIKPIIEAFVAKRPNDRIGVVTFGGRAYTLAPLTTDHDWLRRQLERLKIGLIEDGTAIGDALALAVARLDQPERQENGHRLGGFVVLLTDGANNAGALAPTEAAALAHRKGIPVYTIAAGQSGPVPMPVFDENGRKLGYQTAMSDLDEETLSAVAKATGGRYFRAADADTIESAFAAIDRERPIDFDAAAQTRATELFPLLAWPGLLLMTASLASARPARTEAFA